jgi:hypothetical protein
MELNFYLTQSKESAQLQKTLELFVANHSEFKLTVTDPVNLPEYLLPMVIVSKNGNPVLNLVKPYSLFGGPSMRVETVEYVLGKYKVMESSITEDPREYPYNADDLLNFPLANEKAKEAKERYEDEAHEEVKEKEGSYGDRIRRIFNTAFN